MTSSWGGQRYLPFCFTEHRVLQLANVLRSVRARKMSKKYFFCKNMILEIMKAIELKSDLHSLIDKVNDVDILRAVKIILTKESKSKVDWADTISSSLKVELEESILEADHGKTLSHDEAMKQIKSRYNL